jgi:hypothetical protein
VVVMAIAVVAVLAWHLRRARRTGPVGAGRPASPESRPFEVPPPADVRQQPRTDEGRPERWYWNARPGPVADGGLAGPPGPWTAAPATPAKEDDRPWTGAGRQVTGTILASRSRPSSTSSRPMVPCG